MFKRSVKNISDVLNAFIRQNGLEGPLLQKRTLDAWDVVVGKEIAARTQTKVIKNQTLYVKIISPALRQDLSMMRTKLLADLKEVVGSEVVTDIKFF